MPGLIGQNLGRYQILELIGTGGMATVYKAHDTHLLNAKILRPERSRRTGLRLFKTYHFFIFVAVAKLQHLAMLKNFV
jgi:serine/threonine protein kinase